MSFTLAALIVAGLASTLLALVCYHLLSRLDGLERAVQGGLQAPTRRLTRHEFEQRFERAIARSRLASRVGDGLVIAVGAEFPESELAAALAHLPRADGVHLLPTHPRARQHLTERPITGAEVLESGLELGVTVTPFVFVIDAQHVRRSAPVTSTDELLELIRVST